MRLDSDVLGLDYYSIEIKISKECFEYDMWGNAQNTSLLQFTAKALLAIHTILIYEFNFDSRLLIQVICLSTVISYQPRVVECVWRLVSRKGGESGVG